MMKISIKKATTDEGYILRCCEKVFSENNKPEPTRIVGVPMRMVFESLIWDIGEQLRKYLSTTPPKEDTLALLSQIIEVIKTSKYRSGRESFVMLLHFFKKNRLVIEVLKDGLHDTFLYGHSVRELNKMKLYIGGERMTKLYDSEQPAWIKKELKKNIERACFFKKNSSTLSCELWLFL